MKEGKEFRKQIKIALINKEISRIELADKLRISTGMLNHYISGFSNMPEDVRKDIIEILELDEVV